MDRTLEESVHNQLVWSDESDYPFQVVIASSGTTIMCCCVYLHHKFTSIISTAVYIHLRPYPHSKAPDCLSAGCRGR
ncbi:Uncharacterized protein DAT39_021209 [Clarias magur]|uniref:Uncharacterized protein n=1 Tax=Clarias magur TaxID=1594786 RepID=A0A8J4WQY2_CLAMG|nr:Uncharacterized protein DAT39_021209 [Clarias magur]